MLQANEHGCAVLPEEQHRLLQWNQTAAKYPAGRCIHELFEEQVERTPLATAVVFEGAVLRYGQLNAKANQLARYLQALGVGPDRCVAICLERSLEMVVGILATLKAGGAYIPLDPAYPAGRLSCMLSDSAPLAMLTHAPTRSAVETASRDLQRSPPVLDMNADAGQWATQSVENLAAGAMELTSQHLAYIIYTSGSTGTPKGVMTEHRALVNRLCWMQSAYHLTQRDAVLQKTPFSFDVSVWEFLWTLITGARLVMARPESHKDPVYLRRIIQEERITTLHFVPSMLQLFLAAAGVGRCTSLRQVICSGEALPAATLQRFSTTFPRTPLHNLYGPTEAAIDVTAWSWVGQDLKENETPPIGRPIWNTEIHILDANGNPVPISKEGEIHIGGVGLARGYLNRPDLTSERFVTSRFMPARRLYKTGDIGRYRPDGNIEYLGRNDYQVKINGLRIELGEIESRLLGHPRIREAVVIAREDKPGDKRLVAYYAVAEGQEVAVDEIKAHLSATLAKYMVPSIYLRLTNLPLTLNGKLDRNALPAPTSPANSQHTRPS